MSNTKEGRNCIVDGVQIFFREQQQKLPDFFVVGGKISRYLHHRKQKKRKVGGNVTTLR